MRKSIIWAAAPLAVALACGAMAKADKATWGSDSDFGADRLASYEDESATSNRTSKKTFESQIPSGFIQVNDHQDDAAMDLSPEPVMAESSGCEDGSCAMGGCCGSIGTHRTGVFVDFLDLRARGASVDFAVEINGSGALPGDPPVNQGIQIGPTATVDPDSNADYRVGLNWALDGCSSLMVTYTAFDSSTENSITAEQAMTLSLRPLVTHPLVSNAAATYEDAFASLDVDFDLVDLDYRWLVRSCDGLAVNAFAGVRYGRLEQNFYSLFSVNGERTVATDLSFEGGGLRVGLDFERHAPCFGLFGYGKAAASFLFGEVDGSYYQASSFAPDGEVNTDWNQGRAITMLDLELGAGWQSCNGRLRASVGYMASAWINAVVTEEFINSVHTSDFSDLGQTVTFDGLVVRGEVRY